MHCLQKDGHDGLLIDSFVVEVPVVIGVEVSVVMVVDE